MDRDTFGDIEELVERFTGELPMPFAKVPVDIVEYEDRLVVRADLPGFTRDDIDLTLQDRHMTIEATRSSPEEDDGEYRRHERTPDDRSRTIKLPVAVSADGASATLEDGVLEVSMEKRTEAGPTSIDVS